MQPQKHKKLCILHDTFIYQGGAERLMIMMARALDADLASAYFDSGSFNPLDEGFTGSIIALGKRWHYKYLSQLKLQFDFIFRTSFLRKYDTVILSGDCLSALRNVGEKTRVFYYCHTPPRYLFDQREAYEKKVPKILRPIYRVCISIMKKIYLSQLSRVNIIYTNSRNTQRRIMQFTGRESIILYPPVDCTSFVPSRDREQYYFSYARLSTIKRIDVIVRAFQKMPNKNLIVHYGLNDPQRFEIESLIKGYPNIQLVHIESQTLLKETIARSFAVVYIPENEDFGMIPLESMSCGVPVIGVNDGGLRETILDQKTGWLIAPQNLEQNLITLIQGLDKEKIINFSDACRERAQFFSLVNFEKQVRKNFLG